MEHVSLGLELLFALLKLELWRCWHEHCGCCYAVRCVGQDEDDGLCCRSSFEIDTRYYRGDRYYTGSTMILFEVLGEFFFPDIVLLRLKQFWN